MFRPAALHMSSCSQEVREVSTGTREAHGGPSPGRGPDETSQRKQQLTAGVSHGERRQPEHHVSRATADSGAGRVLHSSDHGNGNVPLEVGDWQRLHAALGVTGTGGRVTGSQASRSEGAELCSCWGLVGPCHTDCHADHKDKRG